MNNLQKTYDPKAFEEKIYAQWKDGGYFTAHASSGKEPYTIVMPPPNVTGNLHLGHAMNNTIQDILIRWKRLSGYEVLWVPGTDHASISTEAKVVQKINEEGKSKEDIGREAFIAEAWEWTHKYGGNIKKQLEKLGVSCDWTRDSFTLDENLSQAVVEVFVRLYEEGYIYQGDRIVNWCTSCGTAVSDAEVDYEDTAGKLYHIKYPVKDSEEYVVIATTRPETLLGDLAVAVNPEDPRYTKMVGKTLILPIVEREIPIIEDSYVEMDFGTGVVKITPSHDPNDFEVGERHQLGQCVVIDEDGKISEGYGDYSSLSVENARKKIIEELQERGYLLKIEDINHAVGHCERCNTTIEPLISKQWFVRMEDLVKPAIAAYNSGELKLIPERFGKVYLHWLENIRDWCISRQLWWGHRLPVYYCRDCNEITVARVKPEACAHCGSTHIIQDEDTLDTWFSSALWPFSTLGWPNETEDLQYFFPTDVLVTGYDILLFWVIRMVFSSLHHTGEIPFKYVYFTGLIRDSEGRKMSKSLNNGVDPLDVIDEYGADALRFTLITGNTPGNDMRYSTKRVEANRNFANKLWNASRFVFMNLEDNKSYSIQKDLLEIEDEWILSRAQTIAKEVTESLEKFEFGMAASKLYDFIWNEYCDWYIEFSKNRLYGTSQEKKEIASAVLLDVLMDILKLLHPFMPYITEEIYSLMPNKKDMLINEEWPTYAESLHYEWSEKAVSLVIEAITGIRNARREMNIAPAKKAKLLVYTSVDWIHDAIEKLGYNFKSLANIEEIQFIVEEEANNAISIIKDGYKMFIPLEGLIDYEKELQRLSNEKDNLLKEIARAESKLSNEAFVSKAPSNVVDIEREKLAKYKAMYEEILVSINENQKGLAREG